MAESLEERFQRAAERMRQSRSLKLTDKDRLDLYSLFKQAQGGDCTTQRPGWFDFQGKAKWDSWSALAGMSKTEAMSKYIDTVEVLDPHWETSSLQPSSLQGSAGSEETNSVGHSVSTLAGRDVEESLADDKKTMFDWCKEGQLKKLSSLVTADNANQTDNEGMGLLHWACDRGNLEVVRLLIERGADVNIQDRDKQTPLHYAVSCDHSSVVSYLLHTANANRDLADCDGNLPQDVADNPLTKQLFLT